MRRGFLSIIFATMFLTILFSSSYSHGSEKILIIVNEDLYPSIVDVCSTFQSDLSQEGYQPIRWLTSDTTNPAIIKDTLFTYWGSGNLQGAILIGNIRAPYTVVRTGDFSDPEHQKWYFSLDACDMYYTDFTGEWTIINDLDQYLCDSVPPYVSYCYEYPSCNTFQDEYLVTFDYESPGVIKEQYKSEIWLGRIMAHNLSITGKDEPTIIRDYFDWNHLFRGSDYLIPSRARLCDAINSPVIDHLMDFSGIFGEVTRDPHCTETQYLFRLSEIDGSRLIYLLAHSNPSGHSMYSGYINAAELLEAPKNGVFYILNACSACRWDKYISSPSSPNYLGGIYVFAKTHLEGDFGLCAMGFTGVGGFNHLYYLTDHLHDNPESNYGDAFKCWVNNNLMHIFAPHNFVLLGDPTIKTTMGATFVEEIDQEAQMCFRLYDNFPDPFNSETQIEYDLDKDCHVKLTIFNVLGQEVKTLVNKHQKAGNKTVSWDGNDNRGSEVASGIYFYHLKAGESIESKKMVVLK